MLIEFSIPQKGVMVIEVHPLRKNGFLGIPWSRQYYTLHCLMWHLQLRLCSESQRSSHPSHGNISEIVLAGIALAFNVAY